MRVQKWGNSAAMRLNAELLKQWGVKIGDTVEAEIADGALIMRPVQTRPVYRLADLLAEMPSDGLPRVAGWDEMPALGKECE
mgnify:CR=1 FL=1